MGAVEWVLEFDDVVLVELVLVELVLVELVLVGVVDVALCVVVVGGGATCVVLDEVVAL